MPSGDSKFGFFHGSTTIVQNAHFSVTSIGTPPLTG